MATPDKLPRKRIFVLLPALDEEAALRRLIPDIFHATDLVPADVHVVVVDDGSTDGTARAAEFAPEGLSVEVIRHGENRGLAAALTTGIERALALGDRDDDVLVAMDADHTHPPESIPKMVGAIWEGGDVVIASRYQPGSKQKGVPRRRRILSWGARLLFRLLLPIPGVQDYTCGFRAYRLPLLREAHRRTGGRLLTSAGFACTDELLIKLAMLTDRISEVPFTLRYDRKPGDSKLKLGETIRAQLRVLGDLRRLRRRGLPNL
jgi:dolichol-phosphate mannosyltransferase